METTSLFRDALRRARQMDSLLEEEGALPKAQKRPPGSSSSLDHDILGESRKAQRKPSDPFTAQANSILLHINKLQAFLDEHTRDYLLSTRQTPGEKRALTDFEMDQIDMDAQSFAQTCRDMIAQLKSWTKKAETEAEADPPRPDPPHASQRFSHYRAVADYLALRLQRATKAMHDLHSVRMTRATERKGALRLDSGPALQNAAKAANAAKRPSAASTPAAERATLNSALKPSGQRGSGDIFEDPGEVESFANFDPEETKRLELENTKLIEQLGFLSDQVKSAEQKMVEIARLQSELTTHISSQANIIEEVETLAMQTTANTSLGNEELVKAAKNFGSFRVWIMIFLVLCSLSLLFLDWYTS